MAVITNDIEITVKVKDQATAEVAAIAEKLRGAFDAAAAGAGGDGISVPVIPDISKFEGELKAEVEHADAKPVEVPLKADGSRLDEEAKVDAEHVRPDAIKVPVETDSASSGSALRIGLERVRGDVAPDAERVGSDIGEALSNGLWRDAQGRLRNASGQFATEAERLAAGLDVAGNSASSAGKKASDSGNGFDLAKLKMAGMVTGALALGPALAAIPAVTAAVTVGVGTMALGFGGVISALKDYGTQSTSSGQSGAQMAQTAFSNAIAVRNAQQAITDAQKQAAQSAVSSADQIHAAQEQVANSSYSLTQSQQTLTEAEKSLADAQKALTQAQLDAANQQKDLNNATADASIATRQAELSLTEAREKLVQVNGDARMSDDQRRQAALDLASAQQGLADAQQRQAEAQQASDAANKSGVSGMAGVVSAQDAVQKGAQSVATAQHGVATAAQAQSDAQTQLVRAQQNAATQQASSAEAIAKAVQNLSDVYEQQKLAASAAASAGSAGVNKFAQDMAKLTPAGRAFVDEVLGMKGSLDQLKVTAQNSMLPGFMPLLDAIKSDMPGINGAIGQMGSLIGGFATKLGGLLQDPAFRGDMSKIFDQGLGAAKTFSDGVIPMVKGVADAVARAGPIVQGLATGFQTLMTSGIPAFFSGLVSSASGAGSLFQSVLTLVSNLAGPIGTIAGAMASSLAPAFAVLASPAVKQSLQSISVSIAQLLVVLTPVITMFAQGLAGALRIVSGLLASAAKFMQDNATWAVPLAKGIALAAVAWWGLSAAMDASPFVLIVSLITGVVLGLMYAWEHFKGFRDFLKTMWKDIEIGFDGFVGFIKEWWPELLAPFTLGISEIVAHWDSIVDFIKKLPGRLLAAGGAMWDWIKGKVDAATGWVSSTFDSIVTTIKGIPGKLAAAGAGMWDWIWDEFKVPINALIRAWDSLSFTMPSFDTHIPGIGKIGGFSIGVPQMSTFATGGVLPGGLTAAIGDGGWEPLRLPDGTTVIPHANAQAATASGAMGSGSAAAMQVEWVGGNAGDEFMRWLRKNIRITAGNDKNSVQRALGQTV